MWSFESYHHIEYIIVSLLSCLHLNIHILVYSFYPQLAVIISYTSLYTMLENGISIYVGISFLLSFTVNISQLLLFSSPQSTSVIVGTFSSIILVFSMSV